MNITEVSTKFPLSYGKLTEKFSTVQNGTSAVAQAVINLTLAHLTARSLLDFFDEYNLFISIVYIDKNRWLSTIDDVDECIFTSDHQATRKEAEEESVLEAFQLLEDGLTRR